MARHSGKNGIVKFGGTAVGSLVSWDIEETSGEVDLTAAGDTWETHDTTYKSWSGSVTVRLDHEAAGNQTPRAGDTVAFNGYTEGDAVGKKYFSGNATVVSHTADSPHDGPVMRTYRLKGNGALTVATA